MFMQIYIHTSERYIKHEMLSCKNVLLLAIFNNMVYNIV